jgi:cbb3-type cytochrome oxidase maturation protein
MTVGYLLFFLTLAIFGGAAVLALAWAISSGQMDDVSAGANSIFAADEPIGEMTDTVLKPRDERSDSCGSGRSDPRQSLRSWRGLRRMQ